MASKEQNVGDHSNGNVQAARDLNIYLGSSQKNQLGVNLYSIEPANYDFKENILGKIFGFFFKNEKDVTQNGNLNLYEINSSFVLPENISCREKLIISLESILDDKNIVSIYGIKEIGKTLFLKLLYNKYFTGKKCLYVPTTKKGLNLYVKQILETISKYDVIILDDFPDLQTVDDTSLFELLLHKIIENNKKIILSGNNHIPEKINTIYGDKIIEFNLPLFSIEEITEILQENNLSIIKNQKMLELIQAFTEGHPTIINGLVRYLLTSTISNPEDFLDKLLSTEFKKNIQSEKIKYILNQEDENTFALLSRLDCIGYNFTYNDLKIVCMVEPKITDFQKLFYDLRNVWIKEDLNNNYRISPLVKGVLQKSVEFGLEKKINLAIADNLFQKKKLNDQDAVKIVICLFKGADFDRLGRHFSHLLFVFSNIYKKEMKGLMIFPSIWSHTALPSEIDPSYAILIRTFQIKIKLINDDNADYLINDLIELITKSHNLNWMVLFGSVAVLNAYNFKRRVEFLILCYKKLTEEREVAESQISMYSTLNKLSEKVQTFHILHFILYSLNNHNDLKMFIELLCELCDKEKENFIQDIAKSGLHPFRIFYFKFGMILNESFIDNDSIKDSIDFFESLEKMLDKIKSEIIVDSIVSLKIETLIKFKKDFKEANIEIKKILTKEKEDTINYFLYDIFGTCFEFVKEYEDAISWYNKAKEIEVDNKYLDLKIKSIIHLSYCLYQNKKQEEALETISIAFDLVNKNIELIRLDIIIDVYGEYVIQKHLKEKDICFAEIEKIYALLYINRNNLDNFIKKSFVLFAGVVGWVAFKLNKLQDGSDYVLPVPGFFVTNDKIDQLSDHFDQIGESKYYSGMSIFSVDIGNDEKALEWDEKGFKVAKNKNEYYTLRVIIPHLISTNKVDNTLELFMKFQKIYENKPGSFQSLWFLSIIIPCIMQYQEVEELNLFIQKLIDNRKYDFAVEINDSLILLLNSNEYDELIEGYSKYCKIENHEYISIPFILKAIIVNSQNITNVKKCHLAILEYLNNNYKIHPYLFRNNALNYFFGLWRNEFSGNSYKFTDLSFGNRLDHLLDSDEEDKLIKLKELLNQCV